jgi:hypothetical protein
MVNVYVAAETDPATVGALNDASFSADAGMLAFSAVETATIKEECANAEVVL